MTTIRQRRDTASAWTAADPVLALGEIGWETDTRRSKLGDGTTAWTALDYVDAAQAEALAEKLDATVASATYVPGVMLVGVGIDKTGVADSTTAIQEIADANPGETLNLPAGFYKITSLTLTKGQTLRGEGFRDYRDRFVFFGDAQWQNGANFAGTVIRSTATSGSAITIFDSEVSEGSLADFILIGPGTGTSVGITLGGTVVGSTVVHPTWRNVKVGNFAKGVLMRWVNEGAFYDLTIHGCTTGLDISENVNNNAFTLLDVQRCSTAVTIGATCVANAFYSPISQDNGVGFVIDGYRNVLYNPYAEGTGTYAIDVAGGRGHTIHAPFLSYTADKVLVRAGVFDTSFHGFGYHGGGSALENAGTRTYIQGNVTGILTDTGVGTILVDSSTRSVRGDRSSTTQITAGNISAIAALPAFVAPVALTVTGLYVACWGTGIAASDTVYWTISARRLQGGTSAEVAARNTRVATGAALVQRVPWALNPATFTNANLAAGDAIDFAFNPTGSPAAITGPVIGMVAYQAT